MTREAALLGIPTYSVFAGRPAAIDLQLERSGSLVQLTDPGQLPRAGARVEPRAERLERLRIDGARIAERFVETTMPDPAAGPGDR